MNFVSTFPNEESYLLGARNSSDIIYVEEQKVCRKTGLKFAAFNYINCIVGSGVIGIPFALREAGFGAGLLLLVAVAYITDYSLILMIRSASICRLFTYQGLMEASYGKPGFILLSVLQFIYPFTAMISYNIIVGDTATKVMIRLFALPASSVFVRRDFVIGIATTFVTVPLCLMRDLVGLARASLFAFILILFIMAGAVIRLGSLSPIVPSTADAFQFIKWDIFSGFGIMAFAFMCHHNVFLLYDSIDGPNLKKWKKVTHWSVSISLAILGLFGIIGYATFTGYTEGDVLQNYCWNDDLINVARLAFTFTVLFAFPIECMTARSVIRQLLPYNVVYTYKIHLLITLSLIIPTYLFSITTECLGFVLELNGIFSAIPLAFVLPALIYIKLEQGPLFSRRKIPAAALSTFGFVTAVVGFILLISDWDSNEKCSKAHKLPYCM